MDADAHTLMSYLITPSKKNKKNNSGKEQKNKTKRKITDNLI